MPSHSHSQKSGRSHSKLKHRKASQKGYRGSGRQAHSNGGTVAYLSRALRKGILVFALPRKWN